MSGDMLQKMSDMIRFPDYTSEEKNKHAKEIQKQLIIKPDSANTYIVVTAFDTENSSNFVNRLTCRNGLPIGGYVYDAQNDCYFVECADFLVLGAIPIAYVASFEGDVNWKSRVPISSSVIKKYLSPLQKQELKNFQKKFKSPKFRINFVQMVDPN